LTASAQTVPVSANLHSAKLPGSLIGLISRLSANLFYLPDNEVFALNLRAMLAIRHKHKPRTRNALCQILGILHRHQTIILARQYGRRHL